MMSDRRTSRASFWIVPSLLAVILVAGGIRAFILSKPPPAPARPEVRGAKPPAPVGLPAVPSPKEAKPSSSVVSVPPPPSGEEPPYSLGAFPTAIHRVLDHYELWELDPEELSWLLSHLNEVFLRDLDVRSQEGGGLIVTSLPPGSFLAERGMRRGDLLKDLNGFPIGSREDLTTVVENPTHRKSLGVRFLLDREGEELTIDVRRRREH